MLLVFVKREKKKKKTTVLSKDIQVKKHFFFPSEYICFMYTYIYIYICYRDNKENEKNEGKKNTVEAKTNFLSENVH